MHARDVYNQQQPGDPAKLGAALVKIAEMESSPKQFLASSDAIAMVTPGLEARLKQIHDYLEARCLMLSMMTDESTASWRVGYHSASQFSREYARFFGSSPIKDIARLMEPGFAAADVSR